MDSTDRKTFIWKPAKRKAKCVIGVPEAKLSIAEKGRGIKCIFCLGSKQKMPTDVNMSSQAAINPNKFTPTITASVFYPN